MDSRSATVSGHKANTPSSSLPHLIARRSSACRSAPAAPAALRRRRHRARDLGAARTHTSATAGRSARHLCADEETTTGASAASQPAASPAAARPAGCATREWEVGDRRSSACVSRGERRHGERRGLQRFGVMISPRRRAARKLGAEPRLGSTRERPARPRWRVDLGIRPPRGPAYLRSYATDQQKDGYPAAPPTPSRRRF